MNPSAKDSNIKVIELGDTLTYLGQIDSFAFDQKEAEPINSMSISGSHMLVAIGGKGLGYLNLQTSKIQGNFIDL